MRDLSNILGIGVDRINTVGVLARVENFVSEGKQHQIAYINAHCMDYAFKDREYKDILTHSDILYADGMAIVWASYFYGDPLPERVNLGDFLPELCKLCVKKGYKIFLSGGETGVAEKVSERLKKSFPNLKIAGTYHGFFKEDDNGTVIDMINKSGADIVLVGMGVPRQEKWIYKNKDKIKAPVLWGVGGLFDYYAGRIKRAPVWMRKAGLEWLFRLSLEPARLWNRYLIGNVLLLLRLFLPLIADAVLVTAAWISAYWVRLFIDPFFKIPIGPFPAYCRMIPLLIIVWPLICSFSGLYNTRRRYVELGRLPAMLKAAGIGLVFMAIVSYAFREIGIARSFLAIWALINLLFLLATRAVFSRVTPLVSIEKTTEWVRLNRIKGMETLDLFSHEPGIIYTLCKEAMDKTLALAAILATLPLWAVIVLFIRTDSEGRAMFAHERVGKDGKHFKMYKFRTMFKEADPNGYAPIKEDDPRVTKVGSLLRRWSLDELPQLWNVLKGDMSLVGPRPEMPFIVENYKPWQRERLKVKPGITGIWQIVGRKDMPLKDNIEYDFYYIDNRSLILDLAILLKSLPAIIMRKGAY